MIQPFNGSKLSPFIYLFTLLIIWFICIIPESIWGHITEFLCFVSHSPDPTTNSEIKKSMNEFKDFTHCAKRSNQPRRLWIRPANRQTNKHAWFWVHFCVMSPHRSPPLPARSESHMEPMPFILLTWFCNHYRNYET